MKTISSQSRQILSDTITPIGTFLNLRDVFPATSLFESSDFHRRSNSRSFIGADPIVRMSCEKGRVVVRTETRVEESELRSAEELQKLIDGFQFQNEELNPRNGFFGALAYESVGMFEQIELSNSDELPEFHLVIYRYLLVFDNFKNEVLLIENSLDSNFQGLDRIIQLVYQSRNYRSGFRTSGSAVSNYTDSEFEDLILKAKDHIAAGDVFQLVLSRKFYQDFTGDDFEVYRRIRALNPSPYMFYFDLDKFHLFGASPEAQFKLEDGVAEINPIAGTVKRTGNLDTDNQLSTQLAKDAKENAEHTMLVDLARNDLNRYCDDVIPIRFKEIQEFSHVIHMVSKVRGKLKKGARPIEAFGSSFPAGTLSGAPKYRAMQLIDQYENQSRGFYGGAIGHLAANGDMNFAIVIRTCLSDGKRLEYQAGAGVVMDSDPGMEVEEVYNKSRVINRAIALANQEL